VAFVCFKTQPTLAANRAAEADGCKGTNPEDDEADDACKGTNPEDDEADDAAPTVACPMT
jgi:hypothetical protein